MKKTITIRRAEEKVSSNNSKYLSIEADDGRYSCWEEILFPVLQANIGQPLEVEIFQKGKYENIVGAGDMLPTKEASGYFRKKETTIVKAMDRKEKFIGDSQARREDSIKQAGAARDATLIVTTFYPEFATYPNKEALIKSKWEEWKEYFLGYDVEV